MSRSRYKVHVPITNAATLSTDLTRISVDIEVAGKKFTGNYSPGPNLAEDFEWDGLDAYGRPVQGVSTAIIKVSFWYRTFYWTAQPVQRSFGLAGQVSSPTRARDEFAASTEYRVGLGLFSVQSSGFGGWTFDAQQLYDGSGKIVYDGGSEKRSADPEQVGRLTLSTVAGNGECCNEGEGGAARDAKLDYPPSVAVAPDGTFYISEENKIKRIDRNGVITTIAGTTSYGLTADGDLAQGNPISAWDVAVGPDGTLYVNDNYRIRKIVNGRWVTVAGTGAHGSAGDGGPATAASLYAEGFTVGPDGTVYIADRSYIRRVAADGIIQRIAGTGSTAQTGDGGPALQASVESLGIAVGPDGSVYFTDGESHGSVRRITPDGIIETVAGGDLQNPAEDGEDPVSGYLVEPWGISVASDGTVLVGQLPSGSASGQARVRSFVPGGKISTVAGNGVRDSQLAPDGALARGVSVSFPWDVDVAPDGSLYVMDYDANAVRKTGPVFPATAGEPTVYVASQDGGTIYVFTGGRHVRTLDALTQAVLFTLAYDSAGRLVTVTDADGNVTTVERDGEGNPTAIVAPGGQRTTLIVSDGKLTSISNPAGEANSFTYNSIGLLATRTDPSQGLHQYTYDQETGRLTRDENPAGGFRTLARSGTNDDYTVTHQTAEGRVTTYQITRSINGEGTRVNTGPDGLARTMSLSGGGSQVVTTPDGTTTSTSTGPDPRFGYQSPLVTGLNVSNGTHTFSLTRSRTATLTDRDNPLSMTAMSEQLSVNGRVWSSTWDLASRTARTFSPLGRETVSVLDSKGKLVSQQLTGLAPLTLSWDASGRLGSISSGARQTTFGYDSQHRLTSITDPLQRTVGFQYNAAGRVTQQTLPGNRIVAFTWDARGNLTSVTPPGRSAHGLEWRADDLGTGYDPPTATPGGSTQYAYNLDGDLTLVSRPDGRSVALSYDNAGRVGTMSVAAGDYLYEYDPEGRFWAVDTPDGGNFGYDYEGALVIAAGWYGDVTGQVSYSYDNDFRVASVNGTPYTYDQDGLLSGAGAMTMTRDAQTGLLMSTVLGNVGDSWSWNSFGEPASYTVQYGNVSLYSQQFTRDDAGRITEIAETAEGAGVTRSYGYDTAGRLASVSIDGATAASYTYDGNGNRMTRVTGEGSEAGSYDGQDRLSSYGGTTYGYGANGELQSATGSEGTTTYAYDELGSLRTVTRADGMVIDYVIDGMGRRIGKKVNGVLVSGWLYGDPLQIATELDGANAEVSRFVYGTHTNVPDFMVRGGVTYRIVSDHLGSPRMVVDVASGTVAQRIEYDEFGNVVSDSNPGFQPFGFAGGLCDRDTGLVQFGARDYDPHAGRWTAKDSTLFAGGDANLYGYAFSDPVNFIDPTGLATQVIIWGGAGWGSSSFGHASVVINGTSYSFSPRGMDVRPASDYIARQGFRWGFGFDLNLTRGQEWLFEQNLRDYSSDYFFPTNACTIPIRRGLDNIGFDFRRGQVDPAGMALDITKSGKVFGVEIYAPTKPAVGTSAPWAPFPNR